LQPQSPAAAKLKLEKLGVEEEAISSILVDDKITIAASIISKKTEGKIIVVEDIFLSDIPFSSINKQILTIFAVLIYFFNFTTEII
jgi:regulatory protein YycI of two-component signal transduction system YycFG